MLLLALMTIAARPTLADAYPNPGELLLVNGLTPVDGGCKGTVDVAYGLLPLDRGHKTTWVIDTACNVVADFAWSSSTATFGVTYYGVSVSAAPAQSATMNELRGTFTPIGCDVEDKAAYPAPGWHASNLISSEGIGCEMQVQVVFHADGTSPCEPSGPDCLAYKAYLVTVPGSHDGCPVNYGGGYWSDALACYFTPDGTGLFEFPVSYPSVSPGSSATWTVQRP